MKRKMICIIILVIFTLSLFSFNCFAVSKDEVEEAVGSKGKEAVAGNMFIWFLCAIAFMKVSQKIDSFMSSLGISVGRTGGSLMAEALIAGRAVGAAFQMGGQFNGFGKGGQAGGVTQPAGKMRMLGNIGRKMSAGATDAATGNKDGPGGLMASLGRKIYQNSVGKSGSFAAGVIGSVARGEINKVGTISGENGRAAMESYFGYNASASINESTENSSAVNVEQGGTTALGSDNETNGNIEFSGGAIPNFSDIEMGGGRITGIETTAENPDGIQFAMYDAEKYAKPEGNFDTVTAVDNSKWYKQYAVPAVEKTPYMDNKGKVQYNEKIVQRIPKAPMRKDRM